MPLIRPLVNIEKRENQLISRFFVCYVPVKLETAIATRGKITSIVSATGTVKPINSVDISAEVSALVKEIKVKKNDYIKAGQVLAILKDNASTTSMYSSSSSSH